MPDGECTEAKTSLTAALLAEHLAGAVDLGAHPLHENDTCWWGAVDIDVDDLAGAQRVAAFLRARVGPCSLLTSRAKGYHVALFLAAPGPAWAVRGVLKRAVADAGVKADTIRPVGGNGGWLRLPYHGGAAPGRRVALDDAGSPLTLAAFLDMAERDRVPVERLMAAAAELGISEPERQAPTGRLELPEPRAGALPALPADPRALGLSVRMAELCVAGWQPDGPYATRSEAQMAVLVALAAHGHPRALLLAALRNPRWRIGERTSRSGRRGEGFERSADRAMAYVAATGGRERAAPRPADRWAVVLTDQEIALDGNPFAVLATGIIRAAGRGAWVPLDGAAIAARAGISRSSADRALGAARRAGWIARRRVGMTAWEYRPTAEHRGPFAVLSDAEIRRCRSRRRSDPAGLLVLAIVRRLMDRRSRLALTTRRAVALYRAVTAKAAKETLRRLQRRGLLAVREVIGLRHPAGRPGAPAAGRPRRGYRALLQSEQTASPGPLSVFHVLSLPESHPSKALADTTAVVPASARAWDHDVDVGVDVGIDVDQDIDQGEQGAAGGRAPEPGAVGGRLSAFREQVAQWRAGGRAGLPAFGLPGVAAGDGCLSCNGRLEPGRYRCQACALAAGVVAAELERCAPCRADLEALARGP